MQIKNVLQSSVSLLNQPIVKENVKNVAGALTFAFGLLEAHDIYQIWKGRTISTETYLDSPQWVRVANKISIVCAKISLVLSAVVSRPVVKIFFGSTPVFAVNPWHPRHVISIVAVILALPSVVQGTYQGANWALKKIRQVPPVRNYQQDGLTDSKIRGMAFFNTITSRPTLHIGNQFCRWVLRHYT